jgi:hypothetical protein
MSGFNMPPGVSPRDIPGNEPHEPVSSATAGVQPINHAALIIRRDMDTPLKTGWRLTFIYASGFKLEDPLSFSSRENVIHDLERFWQGEEA